MQEEIEHKTVNFAISTVKLSARTLLKGAQFFLRQYDKSASQGKQSMNRLIRQNRGVTNLEIEKTGIRFFFVSVCSRPVLWPRAYWVPTDWRCFFGSVYFRAARFQQGEVQSSL